MFSLYAQPHRHPIHIWAVPGGTVIVTPHCSKRVLEFKELASRLFSLAKQPVEGVLSMHEHNIAHLDLKSCNLLVDERG